jgi:beta-fructofuranosidase
LPPRGRPITRSTFPVAEAIVRGHGPVSRRHALRWLGVHSSLLTASRAATPSSAFAAEKAPDTLGFSAFFAPDARPFGDTFPFFHDGQWHLFCMRQPRFGHFVTRNLVDWTRRPDLPFGGCTGCVTVDEDVFRLFYTGPDQTIRLATSRDLDHWIDHSGHPVLAGDGRRYDRSYFRDPYVRFMPDEGRWWMVLGSRTANVPAGIPSGCVALATSDDLEHWDLQEPLWAPGTTDHCDCPQLFIEDNRWYLTYLHVNTRYRLAEHATGPWQRPPVENVGTMFAAANSRPASDGRRWISWPWVAATSERTDVATFQYGGPLATPRQWVFRDDGSIGQRVPDEVLAAIHATDELGSRHALTNARSLTGRWSITAGAAQSLSSPGGILQLADVPEDMYFEADVEMHGDAGEASLLLGLERGRFAAYALTIRPRERLVTLRGTHWSDPLLEHVPFDTKPNTPIKLRVFVSGPLVDAFIGDWAVLTRRLYKHSRRGVGLEFQDVTGVFRNLRVHPLGRTGDLQPWK